ncbi:ribosome hibernation-promoting factor, HPF/YfiA family [Succinimonas amylolytica]|uniref:ribosome hibernation-promoting factor, HPF/YfiA family n=1 Tax=Succinimonas amylolytica TaxID=83769 RepID=UPI00038136B2|nr:ribosome-associated translation inhibitor RaiA [Succinimonas amylolytica]
MQINITGHNVEVTEALRNYVTDKMDHLKRLEEYVKSVNVILSIENLVQKAEARIAVKGDDLFAEAGSETMYAAVDALVDKLERQLVKHKEKLTK